MRCLDQMQSLVTTTCLIWPSGQTTVVFSKGFYATYKMYQTCFSEASPFSLGWGLTQFYCLVQTWPNSKLLCWCAIKYLVWLFGTNINGNRAPVCEVPTYREMLNDSDSACVQNANRTEVHTKPSNCRERQPKQYKFLHKTEYKKLPLTMNNCTFRYY